MTSHLKTPYMEVSGTEAHIHHLACSCMGMWDLFSLWRCTLQVCIATETVKQLWYHACLHWVDFIIFFTITSVIKGSCRGVVTSRVGRVSTRPCTTFQGNYHISANIHKFVGAPSRPVGSHVHVATVDRARAWWLQIVWKRHFLVFKARCHGAHPDNWKMKVKFFFHALHGIMPVASPPTATIPLQISHLLLPQYALHCTAFSTILKLHKQYVIMYGIAGVGFISEEISWWHHVMLFMYGGGEPLTKWNLHNQFPINHNQDHHANLGRVL